MPWRLSWKSPVEATEPHLWPRHTNQDGHAKVVAAQGVAVVDEAVEEAPDEARGAAVVKNQMGETGAISVAEATILSVIGCR